MKEAPQEEIRERIRRGRSHKSLTFRGVGCEGQEKTWVELRGSSPQGDWRLVLSPQIGMEGATKG